MNKETALAIIKDSAKIYNKNLCNKNVMFIFETKNKQQMYVETLFLPNHFRHLTGFSENRKGKKISATNFYLDCLKNKISPNDLIQENPFALKKLNVLPSLMKIDQISKMFGEYDKYSGILLQTEKISGNENACMGFVKDGKYYVPNTSLNENIKKITTNTSKIIGILKKESYQKKYTEFIYIKKGYNINQISKISDINKYIDFNNIFSLNKETDKEIIKFLTENININAKDDEEEM